MGEGVGVVWSPAVLAADEDFHAGIQAALVEDLAQLSQAHPERHGCPVFYLALHATVVASGKKASVWSCRAGRGDLH
jgi:hypothetical protein